MKIFGGSASIHLAQKVAEALHISLSSVDVHVFPDGERRIRITEKVVGENCVIIQSAPPPVDTNYMELFFLIDALKRSGAEKITAAVPYFGYQRQDHLFREGEAVSLEVVIRILEGLKIDRLVSIDMHTPKIPDLFTIPVSHLSAIPLFATVIPDLRRFGEPSPELGIQDPSKYGLDSRLHHKDTTFAEGSRGNDNETILVSPDIGGIGRVKKLSELLNGMEFAAIKKNRDLETGKLDMSSFGEGSVAGKKRAILVDDMIASGKTIALAASFLKEQGMKEVIVFATHAVFSEEAPRLLQQSSADKVFVTDTVEIPEEKRFEKLSVLSVAPLIAADIKNPSDSNNPLLSL